MFGCREALTKYAIQLHFWNFRTQYFWRSESLNFMEVEFSISGAPLIRNLLVTPSRLCQINLTSKQDASRSNGPCRNGSPQVATVWWPPLHVQSDHLQTRQEKEQWIIVPTAHSKGHSKDESCFPLNINSLFTESKQEVGIHCPCLPTTTDNVGVTTSKNYSFEKASVDQCCLWCHRLLNPGCDKVK